MATKAHLYVPLVFSVVHLVPEDVMMTVMDDGDDFSGVSGEKDQRSGQRAAVCHEGPEESHAER